MKDWLQALRDGALSGAVASLTSTAALAACGNRENKSVPAPTNAISHWIWGERAARQDDLSLRYTGIGYAIHHASATLWAVLYEKWFGKLGEQRALLPAVGGAATVAALACTVDYTITPRRLRPGYEKRLSRPALVAVYAAFGAGLLLRGLVSGTPAAKRRPVRALPFAIAPRS